MSKICVSHLTFAYEGSYDNLLEDVSFELDTHWRLGLIGRNGKGKTTFLRLLMGEYPYGGSITHQVEFAYFPFQVSNPDQTTRQVIEGLRPEAEAWEIEREISLLDVAEEALERPFSTLSSGEQTKALLAALFLGEPRFLLIDEPTNHLDSQARKAVSRYLASKRGFILVSHDRAFLDGCIDHVLALNRADIQLQKGNFSTWQLNKEREDARERLEHDKLSKEAKRLTAAARQTANWSSQVEKSKKGAKNAEAKPDRGYIGHKAAKMAKRAKNLEERRERAWEEKAKLLKNVEEVESLKLEPLTYRGGSLVTFQDVSLYYGEKTVVEGLYLDIQPGERIALQGKNGAGKSSILRLIAQGEGTYRGNFYPASRLVVSYVPQDVFSLAGKLDDKIREWGLSESLFKTVLRKLDFSREQFSKDMANYSSGQKKKVFLAKSLLEPAHLYVWDEPLNYIDVFSRMQIEELLLTYSPTLLFVEHDIAFGEKIATRVVQL